MHYKFIITFFFLFTCFASLSAQTNWQPTAAAAEKEARKQERLGNLDLTITAYTKAFDLYQANKDIGGVYAGYCLAAALFKVNKVDEALAVADKIEMLIKNFNIDWLKLYPETIRYDALTRRKQTDIAQPKLDAILARAAAINPKNAIETRLTITLNLWLFSAAQSKGQFDFAETHLNKAEALSKSISETNTILYAQVLQQQARHYITVYKENLVYDVSRRLKKVADNLGEEGFAFQDNVFFGIWLLAYLNTDTLAILNNFKIAEPLFLKYFGADNVRTANLYLNQAVAYKDTWRATLGYDINVRLPSILKSIEMTKKALHIFALPKNNKSFLAMSTAYRNMAFMMLEESQDYFPIDTISYYFRQAYITLLPPEYKNLPEGQYPDFNDISITMLSDIYTDQALEGLYATYLKQYDAGNIKARQLMINTQNARRQLIMRNSVLAQNPKDLKSMDDRISNINADYVTMYILCWQKENNIAFADSALHYAEQTNGLGTRRNLNIEEIFKQTGVSDELTQKYIAQQKKISQLSIQREIYQRENKTQLLPDINNQLIAAQIEMSKIDKQIQQKHPTYAQSLLEFTSPSIAQIQKQLSPTSACFIPLQDLASIIICKDTVFYTPPHSLDIDFKPLKKWQNRLHQPNFDTDSFNIHKADYIKNSYYHYQYFFKKDSLLKIRHIDHLLIIPVRSGAGFPFELVLCSPADSLASYADLDYLLRHYTIQYIPSLSLWQQARNIAANTTNNGKILAYAPSYEKDQINPNRKGKTSSIRRALSPLKGAKEEVQNLQNIYYGDYRFAVDANEATFKQQIKEGYAIIHLAMHGLFDDKNPEYSSLAFSETPDTTEDNFFYTYEIAQSRTNAQLVVLSACETAVGQQQAGEGTMSIARYFIYAGVPAIIATRWQVNDQTTAIIMGQFYQNLYNGIPVHKAMQQAQLLYLQHAKGTAQHPFFWSPYINIGYTDRHISIAHKNWAIKYYIGAPIALLLLLVISFYFYRRKKNI